MPKAASATVPTVLMGPVYAEPGVGPTSRMRFLVPRPTGHPLSLLPHLLQEIVQSLAPFLDETAVAEGDALHPIEAEVTEVGARLAPGAERPHRAPEIEAERPHQPLRC